VQLMAYQAINCPHCALHWTLVGARAFHNGNISARAYIAASLLRPPANLTNSRRRNLRG
jgi:hypothetical protein